MFIFCYGVVDIVRTEKCISGLFGTSRTEKLRNDSKV